LTALDDLKAEDVVSIDLHGKTTLADVMIIATGRSNVHVGALAERVIKAFKDGNAAPRAEGLQAGDWVLIDGGDVIVLQAKGRNLTRDGKRYDNDYAFVIHFRDGKIARYEEYCDTELIARVLPERIAAKSTPKPI